MQYRLKSTMFFFTEIVMVHKECTLYLKVLYPVSLDYHGLEPNFMFNFNITKEAT